MNLEIKVKKLCWQDRSSIAFFPPRKQLICICMDKASLALLSVFYILWSGEAVQRQQKAKLARR